MVSTKPAVYHIWNYRERYQVTYNKGRKCQENKPTMSIIVYKFDEESSVSHS